MNKLRAAKNAKCFLKMARANQFMLTAASLTKYIMTAAVAADLICSAYFMYKALKGSR